MQLEQYWVGMQIDCPTARLLGFKLGLATVNWLINAEFPPDNE